jgi:hypothetical protein
MNQDSAGNTMILSNARVAARFARVPPPPAPSPARGRGGSYDALHSCALTAALAISLSTINNARAADTPLLQIYQITTETGMPHLEENLRYATTHEEQCLTEDQLFTRFPVLGHVALKDCRLDLENRAAQSVSYRLDCSGGHGTTGGAVWRLGEHQLRGRLDVKLGGKNMTFYQTVTALPLGACMVDSE